jgi:uncharacterized caspase-like protein
VPYSLPLRTSLLLLAALAFPALAAELPSIDTPLRTGLSAKGDAAVVIGVEDYVYLPQATYASQDAHSMYDFLVYTRGVPSSRVALLQGGTSRRKIIEAVTTAGKQVGAGGTVWVYFAGHGSASPSTRERLILPENTLADAGDFDEQGVRLAELQRLAGSGGGEVMLITDACFTGAGRAGGTLLSDGRAWVPPQATAVGRSVQWDAAQANQVAGPLGAARHGAFTYFAIGAMRGWADGQVTGERDGVVTSEEAQLYVQEALRAVGIRDQAPSLVGEGAAARTLASGATERAPALDPAVAAPGRSGPALAAVSSTASGTSFGSVGAISVDEKLREQACDDDAKTKAGAARGTRLSALVSAKEAEASAAWATLRPGAEGCARLADTLTRSECAAKVEGFVKLAASAQVTLTAGDEVVTTACGSRTRTFGAEARSVTVGELGAAKDLAARLRAAPAREPKPPTPSPKQAEKPAATVARAPASPEAPEPAPWTESAAGGGSARSLNDAGWKAIDKGDLEGAHGFFTRALQKDARAGWALYGRGYANEKLGDKLSAAADYCSARAVATSDADLARELDGGLRRLGKGC